MAGLSMEAAGKDGGLQLSHEGLKRRTKSSTQSSANTSIQALLGITQL